VIEDGHEAMTVRARSDTTMRGLPAGRHAAVPSWHRERPLPQAFGGGARVAVTSAGDVAVAWREVEKGLSFAVRPAGGLRPAAAAVGSGRAG
jgi:hypothetical protein